MELSPTSGRKSSVHTSAANGTRISTEASVVAVGATTWSVPATPIRRSSACKALLALAWLSAPSASCRQTCCTAA
jgi:hypothetical protein